MSGSLLRTPVALLFGSAQSRGPEKADEDHEGASADNPENDPRTHFSFGRPPREGVGCEAADFRPEPAIGSPWGVAEAFFMSFPAAFAEAARTFSAINPRG